MPIEIPKGLPFSVDTWTKSSSEKRHHFLTHAHIDHLQSIAGRRCRPIYSTSLTRTIVQQFFPDIDDSRFVGIEIGESLVVEDTAGDFVVTAFDANHCPGAVMFLFEGKFGNILHTGDCRLTPDCLQSLPVKYIGKRGKAPLCQLDCVFLDCTFGRFPFDMPSKRMAIQQVINCIWEHPDAPVVYLACDLLGQEEILVEVSKTFGEKIYVDSNSKCFKTLQILAPHIISEDSASRFQLLGFSCLYEVAKCKILAARENLQPEPLVIRPSSQWYAQSEGVRKRLQKGTIDQAVRDVAGVWHVCYSIHSSRDELEWALECLAPKWVVSTTPPCRAMELDYMRKHCLNNSQAINDCVLKLLNIKEVPRSGSDECCEILECAGDSGEDSTETQCEPVVISTHNRKRLSFSPPGKKPVITLFGRARLGLLDDKHPAVSISSEIFGRTTTDNVLLEKQDDKESTLSMILTEKGADISGSAEIRNDKCAPDSSIRLSTLFHTNRKNSSRSDDVPLERQDVKEVTFEHDINQKEADILGITETRNNKSGTDKETKFAKDLQHKEADSSDTTENRNYTYVSGSSVWSYSENMRKYYRSLNVPVPQRLPSLVKLMKGIKSRRRYF